MPKGNKIDDITLDIPKNIISELSNRVSITVLILIVLIFIILLFIMIDPILLLFHLYVTIAINIAIAIGAMLRFLFVPYYFLYFLDVL